MSATTVFQCKIYRAGNEELIFVSKTYSNPQALYEDLRANIDALGKRIEEHDRNTSNFCEVTYIGDKNYQPGEEYNDENRCWDVNRETLAEWIEFLIEDGEYECGIILAYIVKKPLYDEYQPEPETEYSCNSREIVVRNDSDMCKQ